MVQWEKRLWFHWTWRLRKRCIRTCFSCKRSRFKIFKRRRRTYIWSWRRRKRYCRSKTAKNLLILIQSVCIGIFWAFIKSFIIPIQFFLAFIFLNVNKSTMFKQTYIFASTHRHHFHAGCTLAIQSFNKFNFNNN